MHVPGHGTIVVRLPISGLCEGPLVLDAAAARYVTRVLRVRAGAELEVFDPRAGTSARAALIERDPATLRVGPLTSSAHTPPLVLVQGYPKGDKLADIVRDATEIGATLVIPALTLRCVARPRDERGQSRQARLERVAAEAARQCGRVEAPTVLAPMPWAEALEVARAHAVRGVVLYENATVPFSLDEPLEPLAVCIGPEGGLDAAEVAAAEALGFSARALGQTVLRTETAATVALGCVLVARAQALYTGAGSA